MTDLAAVERRAEQGDRKAQEALRKYATAMLEDPESALPASLRSYLINILNGRVELHPPDHDDVRRLLPNQRGRR
jgi:hypothetical protein